MAASAAVTEVPEEERSVEAPIAGGAWSEQLRPRPPNEAVDFGFQFVREHYFTLVGIAGALLLPLAALAILLFAGHPFWVSFFVWWSKPFWERPLLFHLSRALFGRAPTARETLRAWRTYMPRGLLSALTIQRLAPMRSFDLPVAVLEGSTGAARSERLSVLRRGRHAGAAATLTIVLVHMEALLQLGLLTLVFFFLPEAAGEAFAEALFESAEGAGVLLTWVVTPAYVAAILLVAPFYVAGGFSLYLHRRTELEAWDLELVFRRIAALAATRRRRIGASASLAALLTTAALLGSSMLPMDAAALTSEAAKQSIEAILEGEDFHEPDTVWIPRFLLDWELDEQETQSSSLPEWLTEFFAAAGQLIGEFGQILLIAVAFVLIGWLLVRVIGEGTFTLDVVSGEARRERTPKALFGLEITEESLPADVADEARSVAASGRARDALALLYRGALSRLALDHGAELPRGVTERECLDAARPVLDAEGITYFSRLTLTWLRCAYGHREPAHDDLGALCTDWGRFFGADAGVARDEGVPT